jgi:hypothetical protein
MQTLATSSFAPQNQTRSGRWLLLRAELLDLTWDIDDGRAVCVQYAGAVHLPDRTLPNVSCHRMSLMHAACYINLAAITTRLSQSAPNRRLPRTIRRSRVRGSVQRPSLFLTRIGVQAPAVSKNYRWQARRPADPPSNRASRRCDDSLNPDSRRSHRVVMSTTPLHAHPYGAA